MKIASNELKSLLAYVGGAVSTKNTLPILDCVKLTSSSDTLEAVTTNLEIAMGASVYAEGSLGEENTLCVNYKRLNNLVKQIKGTVELRIEKSYLIISTDSGKYKIHGYDSLDFIEVETIKSDYTVDFEYFVDSLKSIAFSMLDDDLFPAMTGCNVKYENGTSVLASTNQHILSTISTDSKIGDLQFTIPSACVNAMTKISNLQVGEFGLNDGSVMFYLDSSRWLKSRIITEDYPKYESIIPSGNNCKVFIDTETIRESVSRALSFSSSETNLIKFKFNNGTININSTDIDFECDAKESIQAEMEGDSVEISINGKYLYDVLKSIKSLDIEIDLIDHKTAMVIKNNIGQLYLITPTLTLNN